VILNPAILALLGLAAATSGLLVYASVWSFRILRGWDLRSGARRQLELERRTYLVSTVVAYALAFELTSLFLYAFAADRIAPLFVGAMCAAGSLEVNGFGYPALILKILGFVLAAVWLVLNHADNDGADYPLVRQKYAFLLTITPVVLLANATQLLFFLDLRPDVITSCCGSLFGRGGGFGTDLASLPRQPVAIAFYGVVGAAVVGGALFIRAGRGAYLFACASALALPVTIAAIVSLVSPYVYDLPTHHCPFCLLQREYGYIGYPWYAALLVGAASGIGVGVVQPFRAVESLAAAIPQLQRRLAAASVVLLGALALSTAWKMATAHLRM
jgi:hypothetical protein